jgi:arylsulfatase A-like enzyme
MRWLLWSVAVFSGSLGLAGSVSAQVPPNILLIIADDLGVEGIEAYEQYNGFDADPDPGIADLHPRTPEINALAAQGVRFRNAWSNSSCATTRATILTGRYGYRDEMQSAGETLPEEALIIPEVLRTKGYRSALIGKWGFFFGDDDSDAGTVHPVRAGYDHFAGALRGVLIPADYFAWRRHVATFDPERQECEESSEPATHLNDACIQKSRAIVSETDPLRYATSKNVADAIDWIGTNHDQPWFLTLSFNAPHDPFHAPPSDLPYFSGCAALGGSLCYAAAIEAMDKKIGELIDWLTEENEIGQTVVIFVADNGPPREMNPRGKFTVYQGGVNVPLIVKGPGVVAGSPSPRVSNALVNTSDLFMTVLDLAGVARCAVLGEHDSYSFVPILENTTPHIRHYAYAEGIGQGTGTGKAIRNRAGLKLQRSRESTSPGVVETIWQLFNLPNETENLMNQDGTTSHDDLKDELAKLKDLLGDDGVNQSTIPGADLAPANLDADANGYADGTDTDADGAADACDNCSELAQDATQRLDTDADGYGNLCDGDFNQDFAAFPNDIDIWIEDFLGGGVDRGVGTDMNCDGDVVGDDFDLLFPLFMASSPPGPSGLACAGTVPCPE